MNFLWFNKLLYLNIVLKQDFSNILCKRHHCNSGGILCPLAQILGQISTPGVFCRDAGNGISIPSCRSFLGKLHQRCGWHLWRLGEGNEMLINETCRWLVQLSSWEKVCKGLFTWREEDPSTGKFVEGGTTFRLLYMLKFQPKWLRSGEGKEEKLLAGCRHVCSFCP